MTFLDPAWLLLLPPAAAAWWLLRPAGTLTRALRAAVLALVVLAMAAPALLLEEPSGTVVVLADRSASMPPDAQAAQLEAAALLARGLDPARHRLAVLTFGQSVAVEAAPGPTAPESFAQEVGAGGSDLAAALRRAAALLPADAPGRVLVLSDGRHTGADPTAAAAALGQRGIAIDVRELSRPTTGDAAVLRVQAPASVAPGEAFGLSAWVQVPAAGRYDYRLARGGVLVARGSRDLPAGASRLRFRDRLSEPGAAAYELTLTASGEAGAGVEMLAGAEIVAGADLDAEAGADPSADPGAAPAGETTAPAPPDPAPENNLGRFIVGVTGPRPLLHVTRTPGGGLTALLRAAGLDVLALAPEDLEPGALQLANASGVILENIAAADVPAGWADDLAGLVEDTGTGLWMTGGRSSFGPGGWFGSAIDPLLPVSMELRQEHRKLALAIVVALDRSGSMSATVPGGQQKMDLANLGTAQVLDLLSPMDEMGVIAVDSSAHTIADLSPVADKARLRNQILRIESMGGGIFVFEALKASAAMLADARAGTRHIVLFADAGDAEEPGQYEALLAECLAANITCSVIGLGKPTDSDAALLRDVATRGGGRVFFTEDARKLPALFAQDTFAVARSAFVTEPTPVVATAALTPLLGTPAPAPPAAGGFGLTYLRPEATPALLTSDEFNAPFVATWAAGLGRAAALTGEADGEFTGPLGSWPAWGDLLASLGRYTAGQATPGADGPAGSLARRRVDEGALTVELLLDPAAPPPTAEVFARVVVSRPGQPPRRLRVQLRPVEPDRLVATVALTAADTAVAAVDFGNGESVALAPARLLYDPEFQPAADADGGRATLDSLARVSGGERRADLGSLWDDLPAVALHLPVAWALWLAAAVVLLLEVLERRTGWLSALGAGRSVADANADNAEGPSGGRFTRRSKPKRGRPAHTGAAAPAPSDPSAPAPPSAGLGSAFDAAARRGRDRLS